MRAMNDPESNHPPAQADWHPADVLAALKKRGQSLAGLSVANGYHPTAAGKALKRPWPAMEALIGAALGLEPALLTAVQSEHTETLPGLPFTQP